MKENQLHFHSLLGASQTKETTHYNDVSVGLSPIEKCKMAMIKLLMPDFDTSGIPPYKGLAQAYVHLTGDSEMHGRFIHDRVSQDIRASQDFDSTSFSLALQNALNVFISESYRDYPLHEEILISQKNKVEDFRKIRSIQFGYFRELPDADPETTDYGNIEPYKEAEKQYDLSQKGAIIWVTRQNIINDNINVVHTMTKRLTRLARVTHAKYVWRFFVNNALCPDGTAWFTSAHGNLVSDALDILPLVTAIKSLANMTEPGPSVEKLGLDLDTFNWHLVVPINMWDTAVKKNQCDSVYSSNDLTTKDPNPCLKLFGERNERIITCPFMTAANDWGVIRDCEEVPILEMSYLDGREEPDVITSWGTEPKDAFGFINDKLGFKMRHEYGGALIDHRGGYKSIVP